MKKYYCITTRYGDTYKLDKDGYVLEHSNGLREAENSEERKTWQIVGAWKYTAFGRISTITLPELLEEYRINNTLLTDGGARYGLLDIDHGTRRRHSNKKVHGVGSISFG